MHLRSLYFNDEFGDYSIFFAYLYPKLLFSYPNIYCPERISAYYKRVVPVHSCYRISIIMQLSDH
jgi:hypothetical protein